MQRGNHFRVESHDQRAARRLARHGFTLMELLVVIVIIVMLASLVLGGLAAAQERSREEQTRATISKINGQVMLLWDAYRTRRVAIPESQLGPMFGNLRLPMASARLGLLRTYQRQEMPDSYADLMPLAMMGSPVASPLASFVQNPPIAAAQNESAECLFLTVTYGMNADAQVKFSGREIGDTDNDGNPEFLDGWGNPIAWLRWAPGFISEIQHDPADDFHADPFDPLGVFRPDPPPGSPPTGFRTYPLIVSAGPDGFFGIFPFDSPGFVTAEPAASNPYALHTFNGQDLQRGTDISGTVAMQAVAPAAAAEGGASGDNIHSHAVGVK
ncbi:MAG: type II secretion system GspH family protein [Pirellulales bacterium]|nr:type II secretion system GspH family protein [Pirellulales bacterium]